MEIFFRNTQFDKIDMQIHKLVYVSSEDIPSSNHFFHGYFIPKPKNCGQLR